MIQPHSRLTRLLIAPLLLHSQRAAVRKAGAKTNVGASAQSFSSKFISKENWAYQAFALLTKLPASKPRQADEGRA